MARCVPVVTALLFLLTACSRTAPPAQPVAAASGQRPAMTEWFYSDGIILPDDVPAHDGSGGIRSPSREWLVIANVSGEAATFTATYYFEDMAPRQFSRKVEARRSQSFPLQDMADVIPAGKRYGARIESDRPIVVQPTRGEYQPRNPVTQAMSSFVAYPGPLGVRETKWAYADGLVLRNEKPLEEREWISILNPSSDGAANIRVRFLLGASEKEHRLEVPAERMRTVDLYHLDVFEANQLASVIVESDRPVIVEQIRKAYTRGIPVIDSLWATLAYPIGDQAIQ